MDILVVTLFVVLTTLCTSAQPTQCPSGWKHRGNSCYAFFLDVPDGWTEAMLYCRALNAKLVEIETEMENEFLRIYLMDHGYTKYFWIGLTDALVEGRWVWETTQTTPTYTNWGPGEPNDSEHHEDCVHMYPSSFHWNDAPCNNKYSFICEKDENEDIGIVG
ncbi:perlucin-like isoform X2 [Ostrea edulis]|nr:perlucin-like isoform X2 [Ostrea edulis]XP_048727621.2 perlucin-like isoform X2 [Ostrea edulis]